MSFEEHSDCFIWRCNGCQKEVMFPPTDFWRCVAELKCRRWSFSRDDDGDWSHYCQRCQQKHQQIDMMDRHFSKPRELKA